VKKMPTFDDVVDAILDCDRFKKFEKNDIETIVSFVFSTLQNKIDFMENPYKDSTSTFRLFNLKFKHDTWNEIYGEIRIFLNEIQGRREDLIVFQGHKHCKTCIWNPRFIKKHGGFYNARSQM